MESCTENDTTTFLHGRPSHLTEVVMSVGVHQRWNVMGQKGQVIWLTGLSASGKSSIAKLVDLRLHQLGLKSYVLDGDNLRSGLCADLSFNDSGRVENIRRAGEVAMLMAEAGLIVVCALISPFAAQRNQIRSRCASACIPFIEAYVSAPLAVCESRDPKGLYRKARNGDIPSFTGIDSAYEVPINPEIELRSGSSSLEDCVETLLSYILVIPAK